jgi:hypothetical protein
MDIRGAIRRVHNAFLPTRDFVLREARRKANEAFLSTSNIGLRRAITISKVHKIFLSTSNLDAKPTTEMDLEEAMGKVYAIEARNTRIYWTIEILTHSTFDFEHDWIIGVPGCETLLHIKPSQRLPGTYELISTSSIVWTTEKPLPDTLLSSILVSTHGESSHWLDDFRLWMPLISFEIQHLEFLRTWQTMNAPGSMTLPVAAFEDDLSESVLRNYSQWMTSLRDISSCTDQSCCQYWESGSKVSVYLEGWRDSELWSRIHNILFDIPWEQHLAHLAEIKAIIWDRLMAEDPTKRIFDDLELRLDGLFQALGDYLSGISFKPTSGEHSLRTFSSPGISRELMRRIRDIPYDCSLHHIRERESEIFLDWDTVEKCWEFMRQSRAECDALRIKFFQLDVLRRLGSRTDREFLIS